MHRRPDVKIALEALRGSERLVPDYILHRTEDLDPAVLRDLGYSHLIFDFDNTLTFWGGTNLPPSIQRLFESLIHAGFSILVASNGRSARFSALAEQWRSAGISFIGRCGKPKTGKIESFMEENGWNRDTTLFIGDNLGADVGAARSIGCSVALVTPRFWLEFPLTKIWRFVEWVHRRRRAREWASVPSFGDTVRPSRGMPRELFILPVVGILIISFHLPLTRTPVPGSSLSSYHVGLAESGGYGWPEPGAGEPERSVLLSMMIELFIKVFGIAWVGPMSLALIWGAVVLLYLVVRRREGWITAVAVFSIALLAPSVLSSIGEISAAPVELILILSLILAVRNPLLTGCLYFLLLLNGLSAICVLPLIVVYTGSNMRRRTVRNLCIAVLCAAAVWVFSITSGTESSLEWSWDDLQSESPSYASFAGNSDNIARVIMQAEETLTTGLIGHDHVPFSFPILMIAALLCALLRVRTYPFIVLYLGVRIGIMSLFPHLFARALPLTLLLPLIILLFVSSIRRGFSRFLPVLLISLLICAVVSGSRDTRHHLVSLRHTYHARETGDPGVDMAMRYDAGTVGN